MNKIALASLLSLICGSAFAQSTPISALPAATTPLAGTEVAPIVQSGTTKKVALSPVNLGALGTTLGNGLTGAGTSGSPLAPNSLFRNVSGATDAITTADSATVVHYSSGSAIATTVPAAGGVGYPSGFQFGVQADGAGTITLTPTSGTVHGSAFFTVAQNTGCYFTSDGTSDWKIDSCNAIGGSSFGGITTSGSAFTGNGTGGSPLAANFGTSAGTIAQGNAVLPLAGGTMSGAILSTNTGSAGSPMYALNGTGTGMFGSTSAQISSNSVTRISFLSTGPTLLSSFTSARNVDGASPQFELMFNGAEGTNANDTIAYSTTSGVGGFVGVGHSLSGTIGTNTTLASGNRLGRFGFFGADGTNLTTGADLLGEVDGTVATSQVPGRITLRTANSSGTLTSGWKIDSKQHVVKLGAAPTCTSCGTGGTIAGNDQVGRVTLGTTPGTTLTITFAAAFANPPVCSATDETLGAAALVTAVSTTAVTFTDATFTATDKIGYQCQAFE